MPNFITLVEYKFVEPDWTPDDGKPFRRIVPGTPMPVAAPAVRRQARQAQGVDDAQLDLDVWLQADIDRIAVWQEEAARQYRAIAERGDHLMHHGAGRVSRMHPDAPCNCAVVAARVERRCRTAERSVLVKHWIDGSPADDDREPS